MKTSKIGYLNTHPLLSQLLELLLVNHITITTNDCLFGKVKEENYTLFDDELKELIYPAFSLSYKHVLFFDKNNNRIFEIDVN